MKRKLKILGLSALIFLLAISVWFNISLIKDGMALSRVLSSKGALILSPDETGALISDLKTADKARLERWASNLYVRAGYDTNLSTPSRGLDESFALY
jgi:hypothetical protein